MSDCCPNHNACKHATENCKPLYCARRCCDDVIACQGGDSCPSNCIQNKNDLDRITKQYGDNQDKSIKPDATEGFVEMAKSRLKCCDAPGCRNEATKEVVWRIRTTVQTNTEEEPGVSSPIARVCELHTGGLWKNFFTRRGWDLIVETYLEMGRKAPKQKYSELHCQPIGTYKAAKPKTQTKGFTMN